MTTPTTTRQDTDNAQTPHRFIETRFILEDTREDSGAGERYVFLSIYTAHSAEHKEYRTMVTRQFRKGLFVTMAISSLLFADPPPVSHRAVAVNRYSARTLREAHEYALDRYTLPDTFPALLEWASRAERGD